MTESTVTETTVTGAPLPAPLTFSFLTLFPELLEPFAREAIVGKARERGLLDVRLVNMRDFAQNKHLKVDDTPYGGGAGMVIRVDVAARALAAAPLEGEDGRWLDLCAGPGGKAALLGALAQRRGAELVANESAPHRAELVRRTLAPADLPEGATVFAELRGRRIPATLVPMPFVSPTYKR